MRTFSRLLGFLRPHLTGVVWSLVLAILAMGATVAIPTLTGRAVDAIERSDRGELELIGALVLVAGVLRLGVSAARRLVSGRVSLGVEYDLRQRIYEHLQTLELGFFDTQQTGQLMSRTTVDLQAIRFFLGYGLVFIVQSALAILLAAIAMLLIEPWLAALSLAPMPFVVLVARSYGQRARPTLRAVQQRVAELTADVEEGVSGVRVVKAFAAEERQTRRFRGFAGRVFEQSMVATRQRAFFGPFMGFLPQVGLAVVLLAGGRAVIDGRMTTGDFAAFYTYLLMLIGPMRTFGMMLGSAQRATAAGSRVFDLLDRAPRPALDPAAPPLPPGPGHVRVEGVSFGYPGSERRALEDVSLEIPAGTTLALVGPTASGKSTIVGLLARLYEPDGGRVEIDGADVREVDPISLRRAIAVVSDDPFLFSATVADNIAYARPDASREAIEDAARRAQAHEFVERLPDGYDTLVGERGLTLSGGQRQRLAIARALLADPRILVLDDATSSVDASTERALRAALSEAARDRTTIVIAHRPATIRLAGAAVVLDGGRVVASGTHEELLERSELYRAIVEPAPHAEEAIG